MIKRFSKYGVPKKVFVYIRLRFPIDAFTKNKYSWRFYAYIHIYLYLSLIVHKYIYIYIFIQKFFRKTENWIDSSCFYLWQALSVSSLTCHLILVWMCIGGDDKVFWEKINQFNLFVSIEPTKIIASTVCINYFSVVWLIFFLYVIY